MARSFNKRMSSSFEPYMGQYDEPYGPFYGEGFHSYLMYTRYESAECVSWEPYTKHQIKIYLDNGRSEIYHIFDKTIRTVIESDHSEKSVSKDFVSNLYYRMRECDMDAYELAEKVGISQSSMSGYVSGKRMPSLLVAVRIADALECSVNDLIES